MESHCPFCSPAPGDIVIQNPLSYARYDRYPVTRGHLLVVPFRHVADFFELTIEEKTSLLDLMCQAKSNLSLEFHPDGFNIGINVGQAAGQTVMHVHVHLIPRYNGDMKNPEGGVRGVIPEKRIYH